MLQKLLNQLFLGNTKLAGMRTIIVNTIGMLLVLWQFLSKDGGLFTFLCQSATWISQLVVFCNITETTFYVTILGIVAAMNNILRFITVTPVGEKASPAQLSVGYRNPTTGYKIAAGIAVASVAGIIAIIIKAIV